MKYQIGGTTIKFESLEWPVYKKYEIISVVDYVERQNRKARQQLLASVPDFYERIYEDLADIHVIVPDYEGHFEIYDPLEYKSSIVQCTMKIYRKAKLKQILDEIPDRNIIDWVSKYGLPYKTSRRLRLTIQGDEGDHNAADSLAGGTSYYESVMEKAFGRYVMFRQTFQVLMDEAINIQKGYIAYSRREKDGMFEAFNILVPSAQDEGFWEILNIGLEEDRKIKDDHLTEYLIKVLPGLISERLAGYLKFVSPALLSQPSETNPNEYMFKPTWKVFDLWTIMIVQIYEYISKNQKFKKCEWCGQEFVADEPRRKFCPVTYSIGGKRKIEQNVRSYCQNAHAVKKFRTDP